MIPPTRVTVPGSKGTHVLTLSVQGDVVFGHCTCPSFTYRGGPCKHLYAAVDTSGGLHVAAAPGLAYTEPDTFGRLAALTSTVGLLAGPARDAVLAELGEILAGVGA